MNPVRRPVILLVEDDSKLAQLVIHYLSQQDYEPIWLGSGADIEWYLHHQTIDLILLDINLPGRDGFDICRSIRGQFTGPILMLTARRGDLDHVQGLELGADDYLCKPIEPILLLARIRSRLNTQARLRLSTEPQTPQQAFCVGTLQINFATRQVRLQNTVVHLTHGEFELLQLLVEHAGELVTRDRLYEVLLNRPYGGIDRAIDGRVSQLRRKLGDDPDNPKRIQTVWGTGYRFVPEAWQ